jgi:hypothetical protein
MSSAASHQRVKARLALARSNPQVLINLDGSLILFDGICIDRAFDEPHRQACVQQIILFSMVCARSRNFAGANCKCQARDPAGSLRRLSKSDQEKSGWTEIASVTGSSTKKRLFATAPKQLLNVTKNQNQNFGWTFALNASRESPAFKC